MSCPKSVGAQLGFTWDQQTTSVQLSGNLLLLPLPCFICNNAKNVVRVEAAPGGGR
jgi:hypothetical protein